jgi:hypothetical protein
MEDYYSKNIRSINSILINRFDASKHVYDIIEAMKKAIAGKVIKGSGSGGSGSGGNRRNPTNPNDPFGDPNN